MSGTDRTHREIRKIAVAFDPSCSTPALLEAAADLAVSLGAELEALFVEDSDMARLSQLPFGRIARLSSGRMERFDTAARLSMRAGPAAKFRIVLRQLAETRRFAYSVREFAGFALAQAANESTAELLVVSSVTGKFGGIPVADEEAIQFAAVLPRSVLLVSRFPVRTDRLCVVSDDSDRGDRADVIATRLAGGRGPAADEGFRHISPDDAPDAELAMRIRDFRPDLLVVGLADAGRISGLLESLKGADLSLLIVR